MISVKDVALFILLVSAGFLVSSSIYTVDEVEQVIITQFVKPVGEPVVEAGLKFKIPFVQSVVTYDKRNLGLDVPDIEVFASNQEQLIAWRPRTPERAAVRAADRTCW